MQIAGREFDLKNNNIYIFGILNVTEDSFSDGGKYRSVDNALKRAGEMIAEGADIIDIGGESTRPGFSPVEADREIEAVLPVIEALKREYDIPVSLDTRKASVALAGVNAGVDIINDVDGLKGDLGMAQVIANAGVPCVLMHNRDNRDYVNLIDEIIKDLECTLDIAFNAGIDQDKIILDPGIGFAKDTAQNLVVLNNLERFAELGYPVLLGHSRKSVIGNTLGLPVEDRLEGTLALTALAAFKKCSFVRVHDIKANKRVLDMLKGVFNS